MSRDLVTIKMKLAKSRVFMLANLKYNITYQRRF